MDNELLLKVDRKENIPIIYNFADINISFISIADSICTKCYQEVDMYWHFCPNCGAKFGEE